jgi:hypothetical protein
MSKAGAREGKQCSRTGDRHGCRNTACLGWGCRLLHKQAQTGGCEQVYSYGRRQRGGGEGADGEVGSRTHVPGLRSTARVFSPTELRPLHAGTGTIAAYVIGGTTTAVEAAIASPGGLAYDGEGGILYMTFSTGIYKVRAIGCAHWQQHMPLKGLTLNCSCWGIRMTTLSSPGRFSVHHECLAANVCA